MKKLTKYKKCYKSLTIIVLIVSLMVGIFALNGPTPVFAATSPDLGENSTYGIISSTYTNSLNAGLETAIDGDICYTTGPGTAPISISGATVVPCADARGTDQSTALADLNAQADLDCNNLGVNVVLSGTYIPGCYESSGTMNITTGTTITLNGAGTYIFRSGGAITTEANSIVALTGGATAADVFWVPNGHVVIGANSSTSAEPTFVGNIIQNSLAAFDVTIGHFVNLRGRVMAFGRTVTTDSVTITVPDAAVLHVIKQVTNNNGGTAAISDFNLHVKLSGTDVNGSPAVGVASPGRSYSLSAGTYVVSEDANAQYTATIGGDCATNGTITLAAGENKTCTITNDDIAPQLTVTKTIINDSGGTETTFPLFIDGMSVTSGVASTTSVGLHTVSETSNSDYASTIGGNCAADGTITLAAGDVKTCTVTNNDIAPVGGGGGGSSFPPSPVPPLIDVVKVPSVNP